jgi:hypothetical protein
MDCDKILGTLPQNTFFRNGLGWLEQGQEFRDRLYRLCEVAGNFCKDRGYKRIAPQKRMWQIRSQGLCLILWGHIGVVRTNVAPASDLCHKNKYNQKIPDVNRR